MKVIELKIRNIRGAVELDLVPDGKTFAIVGGNGTCKSAVVDAIDCLFTGEMSRLAGRRGFDLRKHGKHLNADPKNCYIQATVRVDGFPDPVHLCRRWNNLRTLECIPQEAWKFLEPFIAIARERQYVLTRTGLMEFISAQPKDRATQVQAVLNLSRIEQFRLTLTTASNTEETKFKILRASEKQAQGALITTLALQVWDEHKALDEANRFRALLGGAPVTRLLDAKLELLPPSFATAETKKANETKPTNALVEILRVGTSLKDKELLVATWGTQICKDVTDLNASPEKLGAARNIELIELGLKLIGDATKCPLCDTIWEADDLKNHLATKSHDGKATAPIWTHARNTADNLLRWIGDNETSIDAIVKSGKQGETGSDPAPLQQFALKLAELKTALADPLANGPFFKITDEKITDQLGLHGARDLLRKLLVERRKVAAANPVQLAWDTLTRLEENLGLLTKASKKTETSRISAARLVALRDTFVLSRDEVLAALYDAVSGRFAALYRELHAPDEQDFGADLIPSDAGISLEVDFRGKVKVAPFALHSDGHQDSMGLCLFLALAERVQGTRLDFCILDDVVMAIDAGHRLKIARLLKSLEQQTQFIITTHDLVWAAQLRQEGCIKPQTTKHLLSWSLDGGTIEGLLLDFDGEAEVALKNANVTGAAAKLRRGLEEFFQVVADSIAARPPFSLTGQYEMGEMYLACRARLKELISAAKKAAESWGHTEMVQKLAKFEERRVARLEAAGINQWAVNTNVHYNKWMNMTADEFRPVLEAFKAVCDLFKCDTCHSTLRVLIDGTKDKSLTCAGQCCSFNLEKRPNPA